MSGEQALLERAPVRARGFSPAGVWPAALLVLGMAAALGLIVIDAAAGRSVLEPASPHVAGYLRSLGSPLSYDPFLEALIVYSLCYAGVIAYAGRLSVRFTLIAVGVLYAIVLAGPVLLSQDIFSYLAYARMGVLHGVNPYTHGPNAIRHDPIFYYVGSHWKASPTAYGPLFTLISYPAAWLGVIGGLWALKLLGIASALALVWVVGLCAQRLGRPAVPAMLLVALNPLTLIYSAGGAHNDLLMAALMMLGVWLALGRRETAAGGSIAAAAAVKATAAVVVPFLVLARRRISPLVGGVAALVAVLAVSYAAFGVHALDFVSVLRREQSFVSTDSFANEVAHLFGKAGVYPVDHTLLHVGLIAVVLYVAFRVWRGYDWIAGSGWAMLAIVVTTTWLLAWYTLWALSLAAISRDRRLLVATLAVQAFFIAHQLSPLLSPV